MARLKLGPVEDDKPVRVTLDLPAQVHRDLLAYGVALGHQTGGPPVEPVRLIAPMLARFMASDRGFSRSSPRSGETG
jgi:hypothetical protein